MQKNTKTHHACALEIEQTGILIKGASGSGKTSLCLGLLEHAERKTLKTSFVADDQVYLKTYSHKIVASAPEAIQGLIEIRGYGIVSYPNKPETEISLVVELQNDEKIARMPDTNFMQLEGINLPCLHVPLHHEAQAVRIVFAWLYDNTDLKLS